MQNIVINRCSRGTLLSPKGLQEYVQRKFEGSPPKDFDADTIERTDPVLIQMMRENPVAFGGHCAHIKIIQLPDGFKWKLGKRGNLEWIAPDVD
jgi:hypothetical protein